jgi:hypothetical protein
VRSETLTYEEGQIRDEIPREIDNSLQFHGDNEGVSVEVSRYQVIPNSFL